MNHTFLTLFLANMILLAFVAAPVAAASPVISSISPAVGYTDGKTVTINITGQHFTPAEGKVWLEMSGEDNLKAKIVSWTNSTIIGKIKISTAEETGDWDVVVALDDDDDTEVVKTDGFTIVDKIVLTSITPESGPANDDGVAFTLAGSGLDDIEEVYLYNKKIDENITPDDFDVKSAVKITGTFDLEDMDEDTYKVCVEDSHGTVECDLSFEITSGETGRLEISSSPSGASILVDGTARGTTPDIVKDILEGSHKVLLQKSGYEDWVKMVSVEADETTEVDANLVAVPTTIPTPVPTTIPTSVPTPEWTPEITPTPVPTTMPTTVPTTAKSPANPVMGIVAAGIGAMLVAFRRR